VRPAFESEARKASVVFQDMIAMRASQKKRSAVFRSVGWERSGGVNSGVRRKLAWSKAASAKKKDAGGLRPEDLHFISAVSYAR
jgi:hypothetical protein